LKTNSIGFQVVQVSVFVYYSPKLGTLQCIVHGLSLNGNIF